MRLRPAGSPLRGELDPGRDVRHHDRRWGRVDVPRAAGRQHNAGAGRTVPHAVDGEVPADAAGYLRRRRSRRSGGSSVRRRTSSRSKATRRPSGRGTKGVSTAKSRRSTSSSRVCRRRSRRTKASATRRSRSWRHCNRRSGRTAFTTQATHRRSPTARQPSC